MTNDLTLLTAQDVRDKLVDIIARMPDAVNPTNGSACVYTHATDHDRHCIAGQLAAEQGWRLPEPGESGGDAVSVTRRLGWPLTAQAAQYLWGIQKLADNVRAGRPDPVPWGSITLPPVPSAN